MCDLPFYMPLPFWKGLQNYGASVAFLGQGLMNQGGNLDGCVGDH
jgi:hypothetical protein